jgi:hypothetical protein
VFAFLLLALGLPAAAHRASAQPAGDPPAPALSPMHFVRPGAPGARPTFDPSPLLDQWRAQGGPSGGDQLLDQQALRKIRQDAGVQDDRGAPPAPNGALAGATGSAALPTDGPLAQPNAPITPSAAAAPTGAAGGPGGGETSPFDPNAPLISPQATNCANALVDSAINDPSNANIWPVYAQKVYYIDDYYTSFRWAFQMIERGAFGYPIDDDDTIVDTSRPGTPDVDAIGQVFNVAADAQSITVKFNFRYSPFSANNNDRLYYEFYDSNGGALGTYRDGDFVNVANYADGGWWTQTGTFSDAAFLNAVRGKQIILVISTYNNNDSFFPVVWIDDIFATVCRPSIISGKVSQAGATTASLSPQAGPSDLSDAYILLTYATSTQFTLVGLTQPNAAGNYQFTGAPALPAGAKYQVWFLNYSPDDTLDDSRVSIWAGPAIASFAAGEIRGGLNFDITDVQLLGPTSFASTVMSDAQPVTFNWRNRGLGDRYQFCIYDRQTVYPPGVPGAGTPVQLCTDVLASGDVDARIGRTSFPADYSFRYDREYSWYITVYGAGSDLQSTQSGLSFYEHAITFRQTITPPPNNPPPPNPDPPPPQTGKAWTVMIYIAGDNNLGDTLRTPNPVSNLQGQWASLKALASKYPNINLVTLTDFYGNTGTQLCYLRPVGAPQCQQLGEKNTADPATLADFITKSQALYPAAHTMLIISDHGHSVAGVATDETTANAPNMTPDQIRQAFDSAGLAAKKLDVLFYNTCLMGTFDAVFDASAYARYMVASTDLVWVLNVYDRLLPLLSSSDPRVVASGIVGAYRQSVDGVIPTVYKTMAAYDLSPAIVNNVNSALSALGQALSNSLVSGRPVITTIRGQVQVYDSSGNNLLDQIYNSNGNGVTNQEEDAFVDIRHLATLLASSTDARIASVKPAANNLLAALGPVGGGSSLVIASQQVGGSNGEAASKTFANASGLGVYFPNGTKNGGQPTLTDAYLYKGAYRQYHAVTNWDDFLRAYLSGTIAVGPGGVARGPGGVARGARPAPGGVVPLQVFLPRVGR